MNNEYDNEISMYPDIIDSLTTIFNFYGYSDSDFKIYKTWKEFHPDLKTKYSKEIDILDKFANPDITVVYKDHSGHEKTLIVEVKKGAIVMKDIAQAKIYGDIFDSDYVFLVSLIDLRRKVKEYYAVNNTILGYSKNRTIRFVQLKDSNLQLQTSFPTGGEYF